MKRLLRPYLSVCSALLALGLILAACAPAAPPSLTPKPPAPVTPAAAATTAPVATPTPSEADRVAQLVEGAKKEGKLVIWSSLTEKETASFFKVFKEKYPSIEIEHWRSNSEGIAEKVLTEARAGRYTVDVIGTMGTDEFTGYKAANLLMKYDYPSTKDLPPALRNPEGLWMPHNTSFFVITYNTDLVSPAEAPKNWEDLLHPRWKGQIAIEETSYDLLLALWKAWGKEKAVSYLEGIRKNDPLLKKGHTAMTEMLAAGEFKVAVKLYLDRVLDYQSKKAPIEWVRTNPMMGKIGLLGIAAKAPHPNAAKLFMDWWGSEEGQRIYESATGNMMPKGKLFDEFIKRLNFDVVIEGPEMEPVIPEAIDIFRKIFWPQ